MKVRGGASAADITALERIAEADKSRRIGRTGNGALYHLRSRTKNAEALIAALARNPHVEYVAPNYVLRLTATPNDPSFSQLWGLKNTGQIVDGVTGAAGADIEAEAAWNVTTGSSSIVVGIVDTGIDYTHPDLVDNMWTNPGGAGKAECAAGTFGYNAITDTCDPMDDNDHGTHVAGTIGATGNNARGVTGLNWDVSLMALKFLGANGYGTTADAVAAIEFAVQARIDGVNIRVLSNSWGGGPFSKALLDIINRASEHDILFVASAGNQQSDNDDVPHYPSSYATPNMIAVAATGNSDGLASFSNYGATTVHLGAPGVSILSTVPDNGYAYFSGTSMAAPHVSGVAALVLANNPSLTAAQVKSAILDNVDRVTSLTGRATTGGRLNAAKALGLPGTPDFTITVSPSHGTLFAGGSASYHVTVLPVNGFTDTVNFSATQVPQEATATFTPSSSTTGSTLVLTTTRERSGSDSFFIHATNGSLTRTTPASVFTQSGAPQSRCPRFSSMLAVTGGLSLVASADFDRDGRNDLVTVQPSQNRALVYLADGEGSFDLSSFTTLGSTPAAIIAADLNADGAVDFATANALSHDVSVVLGNGDGTFRGRANYGTGSSPFALIAGDFDADGSMDLAVANNGGRNVSVLLGQRDGTFASAIHSAAGMGPYAIAAGDFDRDGALDLAVANFGDDNIALLRGNGDGTFQAPLNAATGNGPSAIDVADFNRDGKLDLAVSNYHSGDASVLIGNGDGTFAAAAHFAVGTNPFAIVSGDLTADGHLDLAVANEVETVAILVGNGAGSFTRSTAQSLWVGNVVTGLAIAELTGDGKLDLAVPYLTNSSYYWIPSGLTILADTNECARNCGTIAAAVPYAAGTNPASMAAGDFNRDGRTDAAIVNQGASNVSIALGNSSGAFAAGALLSVGTAPRGIAAGDLDRDGALDLAVGSGSDKVSILLGNGDGTFQTSVDYTAGALPRAVALGDFDRDGALDLAVAARGTDSVAILFGNGDGTFDAPVTYGAGDNPEGVSVGDFNRDGRADLAVASSGSGNVSILLGKADGTFQTAVSYTTGTSAYAVAAADLDRDGALDLAVSNAGSDNVSVLLGNGNGTFDAAVQSAAGDAPYALTAADFNDDGLIDLATANASSSSVSILFGAGGGAFAAAVHRAAGVAPGGILHGDFNGDDRPDLAAANGGSANFSVFLITCPMPDLVVAKTHSGSFTQGQSGATYTITVTNAGAMTTSGTVTVNDTVPFGLVLTAMSGSGWTCTTATASCTRSDALAPGASYPPITLTVRVSSGAPASVTNEVAVRGGGETATANNTASDPTTVLPATDVVVSKVHTGSFVQGATGRVYTITVRNAGAQATSGTVSVTDTLPAGLTATAIAGTGWSCTLGTLTCTRSDVLAGGSNYPPISLTVNVAANAPPALTNTATVSGGSDSVLTNNTAADPTVVWSSQSCDGFGRATHYSGFGNPRDLAVTDFNGDGKQDVATTSEYPAAVLVVLGNGSEFSITTPYAVPSRPIQVAAGDINGDGRLDVVAASSGGISSLLGNGDGTFDAAINRSMYLGGSPSELVLADFDSDGTLDAAVTVSFVQDAFIFLGNGDGSWQEPLRPVVPVNHYVRSLAIGDVDRDGALDLIVGTNSGPMVLLGNGDGTFANATTAFAAEVSSVTVADFNGDGKPDIAATSYWNGTAIAALGYGDGTFMPHTSYPVRSEATGVVAADVNADGKLDLIVGNESSGNVGRLLGNGNGTFRTADLYPSEYATPGITVTDFNGDGKPDVMFGSFWTGTLGVMLGNCVDVSISKSHTGNFRGGQADATYNITVRNNGTTVAVGKTRVTDTLPSGLTATAIQGSGWTCTLSPLACERTDPLAGGTAFSPITLTVTVSTGAPTSVTNVATVTAAAGDMNSGNNTASDPTTIVHAPDLTVTKTHNGTFAIGSNGIYTIIVGNVGSAPSSGTITVIDTLPAGMSAVSMTGTGWTCTLASRTCTRSDALGMTQTYPPITLTVTVTQVAGSSVTNIATVSGGGDALSSNNTAQDPTTLLTAPSIGAVAISSTEVQVSWNAVDGARTYEVWRRANGSAHALAGTTISTQFLDPGRTPGTTYVYIVRAMDGSVTGPFSLPDYATFVTFTDDPLAAGTRHKVLHITQLRTAVNAVRAAAGLPASTFSASVTPGARMLASHVLELRSALNAARFSLGMAAISYTDPGLGVGTRIKKEHINDLRNGVR